MIGASAASREGANGIGDNALSFDSKFAASSGVTSSPPCEIGANAASRPARVAADIASRATAKRRSQVGAEAQPSSNTTSSAPARPVAILAAFQIGPAIASHDRGGDRQPQDQ